MHGIRFDPRLWSVSERMLGPFLERLVAAGKVLEAFPFVSKE
jgi:hypothetical protein